MSELQDVKFEPPRVTVSLYYKRETIKFENATVGISIEDSQRQSEDTVDQTIERLWKKVESTVVDKVQKVEKAFK